jgi:hypothetical protein
VNVEELKLCRATRQQLRQQRRGKRRRLAEEIRRYNHPPPDVDTLSEGETDASSSGSSCREDFYYPPVRESREMREREEVNPGLGEIQSKRK